MDPGPWASKDRSLLWNYALSLPLHSRDPVISMQTFLISFSLTILCFSVPRASVCTAVACGENFGSVRITVFPVASLCLFLLDPLCWEFYSLFWRPRVSFVLKTGFCWFPGWAWTWVCLSLLPEDWSYRLASLKIS